MGKIKQGILGGFSGKVGTVIGSSWKGISYMKGRSQHVNNPRTEGQLDQRNKFVLALTFLQPVVPYIRIGYKTQADKQTEFNAAMSYIIKNAITGSSPDYSLNYSAILVSRGSLTQVANATATLGSDNKSVRFNWEPNSGTGTAVHTDLAMPFIYNKTKHESVYDTNLYNRQIGSLTMQLPVNWAGDKVEVYFGMASVDGKNVADSIYLGELTIPAE